MSQIYIKDLTFSYDSTYHNIFEHASFQIDTDWKLGFIGRNGRGKTTFLNLLLGKFKYAGTIDTRIEFDYFPFTDWDNGGITGELMKDEIAPYRLWENKLKKLEREGENGDLEEYGSLLELFIQQDGYIIDGLIEKEVGKLGMDKEILSRPFAELSNGEQTKSMLAALFLKKNRFLLIDEPTNHLDLEGRHVIGEYLKGKKGFILVSHDRALLDQVVDHVLSINKTSIEVQKGNYSSWKENKDREDKREITENIRLKKDILRLEEVAKRTEGWSNQIESSKIGNHSGDRGYIGHKSAKMMKKAKVFQHRQETAAEEKKALLKNVEKKASLKMNLLEYPKKRLIEVENLTIFMEKGIKTIVKDITFTVNQGDRVWLKGANGSGKSSIIKLLLGKITNYTGKCTIGNGLKISYVSQDTSYLKGSLKEFIQREGLNETIFKTVLSQLDFIAIQFEKNMEDFSEGQKKKVLLANSLSSPAHIFLWDEPLNFIDVLSRVQLEELILEYSPAMVFVEHDRTFSEKIAIKTVNLS